MFDYARKMQLAASDLGRRAGLKAGAGVAALIAAGFLLAALWTFLAHHLGWGSLGASLAIGVLFLIIAGVVFAMSNKVVHPVPTTDELKREVEARVSLATDAALEKAKLKAEEAMDTARDKAREVVDSAGNRVASLMDDASFKAARFVDTAEAKVQHFTNTAVGGAAAKVGLTPQFFQDAQDVTERVKSSKAMPAASLLGAFAVGMTLASKLQSARHERAEDDWYDAEVHDDWDDDYA